ncbi:hypothetical protein L6R46_17120, partial [Myxococcota bacterium]|nr:hypothetical protein [Myxococcota bacterium]
MSRTLGVFGRWGTLSVGVLGAVAGVWLATPPSLPPLVESARVLDRHGALLSERPAPERARGEALDGPSDALTRAIIAA